MSGAEVPSSRTQTAHCHEDSESETASSDAASSKLHDGVLPCHDDPACDMESVEGSCGTHTEQPLQQRAEWRLKTEHVHAVLNFLPDVNLTIWEVVEHVLVDPDCQFDQLRTSLYGNTTRQSWLPQIFKPVMNDEKLGRSILQQWMLPHAIQLMSSSVYDEMDHICNKLHIEVKRMTPKILEEWTVEGTIRAITAECAPVLNKILCTAMSDDFKGHKQE
ncbi:hypothetical protein NEOLEDRAFT_1148541 [Neolentinus lepideus HHB14362 ss-1]|uniref:Uncharacterized protein n=1 Tax=Neolentinus lepideus HHB14362 ss-1 TaxID=1314782 RepID=A0A165S6T7_9AGAM|nr:hypothetical protein NEOLEDRAFT_1148541 [Neolentinus lepideus HHB14362 ss-1]